MQIIKSNY